MRMPKPKPDQTIRHEIVLSRPDRELLSDVVVAYQINKVATPLVALVSDSSAMLLITGLLEATGVIDLDKGILREISDGLYDNYGDAMKAILLDPVDVAINPLDIGIGTPMDVASYVAPTILKAWVWLLTTGRILTEQAVPGGR